MRSGWFNESYRHRLAGQGIRTSYYATRKSPFDVYKDLQMQRSLYEDDKREKYRRANELQRKMRKPDVSSDEKRQLSAIRQKLLTDIEVLREKDQDAKKKQRLISEMTATGFGRRVPSKVEYEKAYEAAAAREGRVLSDQDRQTIARMIEVERSVTKIPQWGRRPPRQVLSLKVAKEGLKTGGKWDEMKKMFGPGPWVLSKAEKDLIVNEQKAEQQMRIAKSAVEEASVREKERAGKQFIIGKFETTRPHLVKVKARTKEGRKKRFVIAGRKQTEALQKKQLGEIVEQEKKEEVLQRYADVPVQYRRDWATGRRRKKKIVESPNVVHKRIMRRKARAARREAESPKLVRVRVEEKIQKMPRMKRKKNDWRAEIAGKWVE